MFGFEGFELSVEGVVLGVADLRGVLDVITAVVVPNLLPQLLDPAPDVRFPNHATIIRVSDNPLKEELPQSGASPYTDFMGRKRMRKELQTLEAFEKSLREEVSVSAGFDLPLAVLAWL